MLLTVLALIVYFSVKTHLEFKKAVISAAQEQLSSTAKSVSASIYNEIDMLSDNLDILALNEEIQAGLKNIDRHDDRFPGRASENIFRAQRSHIEAVYILDSQGRLAHRYPQKSYAKLSESLVSKPDVAHVLKERLPYISMPFYSASGLFVISLSKPVTYQGEFVGIVRFLVKIDTLARHFVNNVRVGQSGYAQLIDGRGILLATPDREQVGRHITEKPEQLHPDRDWRAFQRLVREMTSGGQGTGIADIASLPADKRHDPMTSKLISYTPVGLSPNPWTVIMTLDYGEVAAPVNSNALSGIIFAILAMVAVLPAGYYLLSAQKELARLQGEEHFRVLFETMHEGVALCKIVFTKEARATDYRIIDVNPSFERHTGFSPDRIRGMAASELFGSERPPCIEEFAEVALKGISLSFETRLEPPGRTLSLSASSLGKGLFSVVLEDITDLKTAEDLLRKSEERYRSVIENMQDVFIRSDSRGRLAMISPSGAKLMGYDSVEEMTGLDLASGVYARPEDRQALLELMSVRGFVENHEVQFKKRCGSPITMSLNAHFLYDPGGDIIGAEALCRDISELRRLEEQLRQAQKMEAIGLLAGGVAHDFNNMLSAIMGAAGMLKLRAATDSPQMHLLEQILNASEKSAKLTQQLLAFGRKQVINPRPTDLNALIMNINGLLLRLVGEDFEFNEELAETALVAFVDSGQIEQVLINLCANARDSMPHGGSLTIRTEAVVLEEDSLRLRDLERPGRYALISVTDTGGGIDEQLRQRIFEPFFTTKETGNGTGLGLSIVFGIVKQHKGDISLSSEPGRGSTFHIYLPLVEAGAEGNKPGEPAHSGGGDRDNTGCGRQ